MHTLDRQPATFDGYQVCFTTRKIKLADSLNQIRREQRKSSKNRLADNMADDRAMSYVTISQ